MFLLKYTSNNSEGYKMVIAKSEIEAIEKLKKALWYLDNLFITVETIE